MMQLDYFKYRVFFPLLALLWVGSLQAQVTDFQFKSPQSASQSGTISLPDAPKPKIVQPKSGTYDFAFRFAENKGQWENPVRYMVRIPSGNLFLEDNRLSYLFWNEEDLHEIEHAHHSNKEEDYERPITVRGHAYRIAFEGANPNPKMNPWDAFSDYENFFIGNDSRKWASYVLSYKAITYNQLYKDIDLKLYTREDQIKYDFIIQPGADPNVIRMNYDGVDDLKLENGLLRIKTSVNELMEHIPLAYQEINGKVVRVACQYTLSGKTVGFRFPNGYDTRYPLVIDPALIFSTYSGSTSDNWGFTATYDNQGNLYAAGVVNGGGWPTTVGAFQTVYRGGFFYDQQATSTFYSCDIGVIKYNATVGQRVYATYLGGRNNDQPHSLVCNNAGELFVMGTTRADDYPTTNGAFQTQLGGTYGPNVNTDGDIDIVITRLNTGGTGLVGSTYIGGSSKDGVNLRFNSNPLYYWYADDHRGEIILDRNEQNIFVTTSTRSANFPSISPGAFKTTLTGAQDGVVFKMPIALTSMTFASFLGGGAVDAGYGLREATNGDLYICGSTSSTDLPATTGAFWATARGSRANSEIDGFIMRINATATSVLNTTYIGTTSRDQTYKIDLDANNNVYVTGHTFGGTTYPSQIAPGAAQIYTQEPTGVNPNRNGKQYISKFSPNLATLIFSSKWGTTTNGTPNITTTAFLVDRCENIYVSGWGGSTASLGNFGIASSSTNGLNVTNDAIDGVTDGSDFYLLCLSQNAENLVYATFMGATGQGAGDHVDGGTSRFDKQGIIYHSACASCGDNGLNNFPTTAGTWSRTKNSGGGLCNMASFKFDFDILKEVDAEFDFNVQNTGCAPFTTTFTNNSIFDNFSAQDSALFTWEWDFGDGSPTSNQRNPTHTFVDPGTYNVRLVGILPGLCGTNDTIMQTITVFAPSQANIQITRSPCHNRITITNLTIGGNTFIWQWGDGNTSNLRDPGTYTYAQPGTYTVTYVVNTNSQCEEQITRTVTVGNRPEVSFTVTQQPCNPAVTFNATYVNNAANTNWTFGDGNTSTALQPSHTYATPGTYNVRVITGTTLACPDTFTLAVVIDPPTVAGTVTQSQTICLGDPITNLTLSGQTGTILRWEQSINGGGTWTTVLPNNTTTTLVPGALNQTTQFRAVVRSANCATEMTTPVEIRVDQPAVAGNLTGGGTFCQGGNPGTIPLSGQTGNVVRWESSPTNQFLPPVTTISTTVTTFTPPNPINASICYRAVVLNGAACPERTTTPVCFQVDPPSQAGNAVNGTTICTGQTNTRIDLTGTIVGNVIRWEAAATQAFSPATNLTGTSTTYTHVPAITTAICFRAVVQSGVCAPAFSGSTCFAVDAATNPGTVSQNQTVCEGTTNLTLNLTGNNGTVVPGGGWQSSTDNFATFTTINNSTTTLNITTPMTVTTCYRAVVQSGSCTQAFSQPACIQVVPVTIPGDVPADQTVCSGKPINSITLTGVRGNVLRWESAPNGDFAGSATTINNLTTTLSPAPITNNGNNNIVICFRAIVQNAPCPALPSDTLCVTVEPPTIPGTLLPNRTVCQGDPSGTMTLTGNRGVILRWESFSQNCGQGTVTSISNTTNVHSVPNMQATTCFRVVVQNGTCDPDNSTCVCVTVDPTSEGGQVTGGGTVCEGTANGPLNLSGQTGTVQTWQNSTDQGVNWTDIPSTANLTTFNPPAITGNTCYRAIVKSGVCPADPSDPSCVQVDLPTIGGAVTGGRNACIGLETVLLTLSGHRSQVLYWESAPDQNFTNTTRIINTTTTHQAVNLLQSTCFRAVVQNGVCPQQPSASTCVIIDPLSVGGTVTPNRTICIGTDAGTLNLAAHLGTILHWESSTDGFLGITTINNTTTALQPGILNVSTCFRAIVKSGVCAPVASTVGCVQVDPLTNPGTLSAPSTICAGDNAAQLALQGNNGVVVRWESSTDGGNNWQAINTVTNVFTPTALVTNTCYRVAVQNSVCPIDFSNPICIQVDQPSIGGTLSGGGTVCQGSNGTLLTLSGNRGTIQRWELSTDNFATITTFSNPGNSFTPLAMTESTCYRVWVKNGVCPEAVSASTCIQVDLPSLPGVMKGDTGLCNGAAANTLSLTGYRGIILRWEKAINCDNGPWTAINVSTNTLATGVLTRTTCFRAWVQNGVCPSVVTDKAKIRVSPLIESQLNYIKNQNCFGQRIGAIGLTIIGGTPPYIYQWNDGVNTEDRQQLPAGTYTLTVTDEQQCSAVFTYTVTEPPLLQAKVEYIHPPKCYGESTGRVGVQIYGGTPPYQTQWLTPTFGTINMEDISDVPAGTYRMTSRDAKGCQVTLMLTITEPEPITTSVTTVPTGDCTFSATAFGGGGTPPYTYLWSDGQTTQTATNLRLGHGYTVGIRDANGCVRNDSVKSNYPPIYIVTNAHKQITCKDAADGEILITVYGGSPEYTYQWTNTIDPSFSAITENIGDLKPGVYVILVTDTKGCQYTQAWEIREPEALTVVTDSVKPISCFGSKDGWIKLHAQGGTAPYTYEWTNGATTEDLDGIGAGDYTLTVKDKNGCKAIRYYTLTTPEPMQAELTFLKPVSCNGRSDGAIAWQISGGTQPYTYLWNTGFTGEDIENLPAGTYSLTATDRNGCTITVTRTVSQPAEIRIDVVKIKNTSCPDSKDGFVETSFTGGTAPYTFSWSDGSQNQNLYNVKGGNYELRVTDKNGCYGTKIFTVGSPQAIVFRRILKTNPACSGMKTGVLAYTAMGGTPTYTVQWRKGTQVLSYGFMLSNVGGGVYTLELTDKNGCTASVNDTLVEPPSFTATIVKNKDVSCFGGSDGKATVSVSGGTSPYTVAWADKTVGLSNGNLFAGTHVATVSDAKGCTQNLSVYIAEPAKLNVILDQIKNVSCKGGSDGAVLITVDGGTSPYTFLWNNQATSQNLTNVPTESYVVTVTDAKGCTETLRNLFVTEPEAPLSVTTSYIKGETCYGMRDGSIGIDTKGGTPPYRYNWSSNSGLEDPEGLSRGKHTVIITDANGCILESSYDVPGPQFPLTVDLDFITLPKCHDSKDAVVALNVRGGTQPYRYEWTNGDTREDIDGIGAGVWQVTVRDANNCFVTRQYNVPAPAEIKMDVKQIKPSGCSPTGSADVTIYGGVPPYLFNWSTGAQTEDLTNVPAGTHSLMVTDSAGCNKAFSITIPGRQPLEAKVVIIKNVSCFNSFDATIQAQATGGSGFYTYQWGTGATTQTVTDLPAGTYSVIVFDGEGCLTQAAVEVIAPKELKITTAFLAPPRCQGAKDGTIAINITGGELPYTYKWSNGSTVEDLNQVGGGRYTVTVTDGRGCVRTSTFTLTEPTALNIQLQSLTPVSCAGSKNGQISVIASGGTPPYRYVWNNGAGSNSLAKNLAGGSYTVTVFDGSGCLKTATYAVNEPQPLTVSLVKMTPAQCNNANTGSLDIQVNGGTAPFTYLWSNNRRSQDVFNAPKGVYTVTVTDARNCRTTGTFEITVTSNLKATITTPSDTICINAGTITFSATPAGGTFSGAGMTGKTFNPQVAGVGTHTIRYFGKFGDCTFSTTKNITVADLPETKTISVGGLTEFCTADGNTYPVTVVNPQAGVTATFTGRGINRTGGNFLFSPAQAGQGTHTITGTLKNRWGCTQTVTTTVQVGSPGLIRIDASKTNICSGESVILSASGSETYTWSPTVGLSSPEGALITATPTQTTTYTLTAKSAGCIQNQTVTITVQQVKPINITTSQKTICEGQTVLLSASSATSYVYTWSPSEGIGKQGAGVLVNPTETTTYTVTGVNGNCTMTATTTVTVNKADFEVRASNSKICAGQSTILTVGDGVIGGPGSGNYSWSPSEGLSATTGSQVLASPNHTITYTVVNRDGTVGCQAKTITVEVIPAPTMSILNLPDAVCANSGLIAMTGVPSGGKFSGDGVFGNIFDPKSVGLGDHVISYSVQDPTSGCMFTTTKTVSVGHVQVSILNLRPDYCLIAAPVTLTGIPSGGRFSGPGINGMVFTPRDAGLGTHIIKYEGTSAEGCAYSISQVVRVVSTDVEIIGVQPRYCQSAGAVLMSALPSGGTFSGTGVTGNIFTPSLAGVGAHSITYFGQDGPCTYSKTFTILVTPNPVASATAINATCPTCADGSIVVTVSGGTSPYRYRLNGGTAQVSNTFTGLIPSSYTITVEDANGCSINVSATVTGGNTNNTCPVPTNIRTTPATNSSLIAWNAVPGAVRYVISWKKAGDVGFTSTSTNSPTFNLRNLLTGTAYVVKVRAVCSSMMSDFSPESPFTTLSQRLETEEILDETISIYPNPNKGTFQLSFTTDDEQSVSVTVFDVNGKEIYRRSEDLSAGNYDWDFNLTNATAGIYHLRLNTGKTVKTIKIVIE